MTLNEAIEWAEELKKEKNANEIITLLTPFWEAKITTNVGALLAYSYRRLGDYEKCLQICDIVDKEQNFPRKIKAQRQWCLIVRDIISEPDYRKAEIQAEKTFQKLNLDNSYDLGMLKFICRVMAKNHPDCAIYWYEKIPSVKLSNKVAFSSEEEGKVLFGISEKSLFYKKIVEYLLEHDVVREYLDSILTEFNASKKNIFIDAVLNAFRSYNNENETYFKKKKLQNILLHLKESYYYRKNNTVLITDSLRMSDVASFVFCPISAVISKTLMVQELSLEYNEHVAFSKKYLNDYFEIIKNKKLSWQSVFNESLVTGFQFLSSQASILTRIFNSQRIALNSAVGSSYLSNIFKGEDISFSPDMVMQDNTGKFCVEEVFTSKLTGTLERAYDCDRVKLVGYLTELKINIGYLIYWNVKYISEDETKRKKNAFISGMKIFEIKLSNENSFEYQKYKNNLKDLISIGTHQTPNINYNKCVSCNVMHYCVHKYGNNQTLLYPYKHNY